MAFFIIVVVHFHSFLYDVDVTFGSLSFKRTLGSSECFKLIKSNPHTQTKDELSSNEAFSLFLVQCFSSSFLCVQPGADASKFHYNFNSLKQGCMQSAALRLFRTIRYCVYPHFCSYLRPNAPIFYVRLPLYLHEL